MKDQLKITLIQMNSGRDRDINLEHATTIMRAAVETDRPDLIALPEYFDFYAGEKEGKISLAQDVPGGQAYDRIQNFARENGVWIHAGSLVERRNEDKRVYNTTVVFNRSGDEVARYRKIHLFDIDTPDGTSYRESDTVKPGDDVVVYDLEGFRVGCAICYDVRFPELFAELARRGADVIMLPAAFTLQTGKDHWDVLCRARAIETQTYFAAPAQVGSHLINGERRQTFGNSLVVDPWGHVIARASDGVGYVSTRIDRAQLDRSRNLIPLSKHHRLNTMGAASCTS